MNRRMSDQKFKALVIIIITILVLISAYSIYRIYFKPVTISSVEDLIRDKKKNNYKDKDDNQIDVSKYVNELPQFRANYGNGNIMGRLEIPNLNINALVTRTTDNSYYLNYNLYNQYDGLGAPFFDYRNSHLATDQQINIYGHNTQNEKFLDQLPFINLEAYVDENIFKNYRDVYLSIDEKQVHYEVVAVKIITKRDNEHMKVVFYGEDDFLQHTNRLLNNTLYQVNDLSITSSDRLLIMQVCHYNPPDTYLLVICREKKE